MSEVENQLLVGLPYFYYSIFKSTKDFERISNFRTFVKNLRK